MSRDEICDIEKGSIRKFVASNSEYLMGHVLDFGSGKQPYKEYIVGTYYPHEFGETIPPLLFNTILCTQVMEYIPDPAQQLKRFYEMTTPGGFLVMTYPTNWDEVESADLWRFTKSGMNKLLVDAGYIVIKHEPRSYLEHGDFKLCYGYGVIAKKC